VAEVELIGELRDVPPESLKPLLLVAPGQTFSRALVTASEERLTTALGNSGYTFASASGIPEVNDDGTVDVRFFVESGNRAYVRRVDFSGNSVTQDEVLRREMRQMEGGWASTALIELSKIRLERLGYFAVVNVETPEVAGTDDQIDVNFAVEEQPSGSISATLGFAQSSGLILGGSYQENNVLGTGNSLSLSVSWSSFQRAASFNYFNPYYTLDGISRGYNLFFRQTDFEEENLATYSTDAIGAGVNFGFPIGETRRLGFGLLAEWTKITEGVFPALEISDFLANEGNEFLNFKLTGNWSSSTLNRGLFPTRGRSQRIGAEVAVPGSELTFFKLTYQGQMYFPITRSTTFRVRTELGFGQAYGSADQLPFYEHFYAGGFGSVRGFKQNTLGPQSTPSPLDPFPDIRPYGGNLLVEGSAELIFPVPFLKEVRSFRPVLFFDFGQVFNTDCAAVSQVPIVIGGVVIPSRCENLDFSLMRYSAGLAVTWITGMGPMSFALSKPMNVGDFDEEETFQFELGRTF
jgi:outer membrane protein insertion porin family